MPDNATLRRLTAILSMDVKGYSKLMGEDDESTVATITAYRKIISGLIQKHQGRVVDTPGDNILAEFGSALNAVNSAIDIQHTLEIENDKLADNRRMFFRIGINVGDILHKDNCIYGDGVNVAARIESLAEPGGIYISRGVFDQVKRKVRYGFEYLGEHSVKNIPEPVRIYRILLTPEYEGKVIGEPSSRLTKIKKSYAIASSLILVCSVVLLWIYFSPRPDTETASVDKMAFPLPEKPSVAVLPFENIGEDSSYDFLSDGITENIITALSKVPKLFIIARDSSFNYKGKTTNAHQVSEEFGVRYVLEGSVQKFENQVRIFVQLTDSITGHHRWSERYDREIKDLFVLQDEITKEILTALEVSLTEGEQALMMAKGTLNLDAYLKMLQANYFRRLGNIEDNTKARRLAKEAVDLDPDYAMAYATLSRTHIMDVLLRSTKSQKLSLEKAVELAKQALSLDDSLADAYDILGSTLVWQKKYDEGLLKLERALELEPNGADIHAHLGLALWASDRPLDSIQALKNAIRLNPIPPGWYLYMLAVSYNTLGKYDEAIAWGEKAIQQNPKDLNGHVVLCATYSSAGRIQDARSEAAEVLRINPKFTVSHAEKTSPQKNQVVKKRYFDSLRKAGLPEYPRQIEPEKPSIAVLPFVNMSGDPDQEYFSDGITEDIITALSKTPKMLVIARNSTFTFKGKPVKVQRVANELGVRYVLEGSVQKVGERVRITAQLVDAKSGHHLWAERYDRNLEDVFSLQDEITLRIISSLRVNIADGEISHILSKKTQILDAYFKAMKARDYFLRFNKDDNKMAQRSAEEAIVLDPNYPAPYGILGWTHFMDVRFHTSKSPSQSMAKAFELAKKGLALDPALVNAHSLLAYLYTFKKMYDEGIAEAERAVEINPNYADGYCHIARILHFIGRNIESVELYKKAMRINPFAPSYYYYQMGYCYFMMNQNEKAIVEFNKAIKLQPNNLPAFIGLAAVYGMLERKEDSLRICKEIKKIDPGFSGELWVSKSSYKNEADKLRLKEGLLKAGL